MIEPIEINDFRLACPSATLLSGPPGSGKTVFLTNYVKRFKDLTDTQEPIVKFTLFFGTWQEELYDGILKSLPVDCKSQCYEGIPLEVINNKDYFKRPDIGIHLCIFDDVSRCFKDKDVSSFVFKLVTVLARHNNIQLFIVLHCLHSTDLRVVPDLRKNVNYIIIFNGISFMTLNSLSREILPCRPHVFLAIVKQVFMDCSHLVIALRSKFTFRSHIFDKYPRVHVT